MWCKFKTNRVPIRKKWDLSKTVVEVLGHDSYLIWKDGSGRTSKRNRRFLKPTLPYAKVFAMATSGY